MNRILLTTMFVLIFMINDFAQTKKVLPDLSNLKNFHAVNREVKLLSDKPGKTAVYLNAGLGAGVAWINNASFSTGEIEFDVKGKDVLQQSFVGIAFHGINDSTYEGIYLRPFNFQAKDTLRKKHAVQYISLPKFDWSYLRETYPNVYEHALLTAIDPNNWLHVKVKIERNKIEVYINADDQPTLSVTPLTHNSDGKLGFWVGDGSDGDFANLAIKNE